MSNVIKDVINRGETVLMSVLAESLSGVFPKSSNVRDSETGYDDGDRLVHKLIEAGKVLDAVKVGIIGTTVTDFKKLSNEEKLAEMIPVSGYRRTGDYVDLLLGKYDDKIPKASFGLEPFIPVSVREYVNMQEIEIAKQDHAGNKNLNSYEVGLCLQRLSRGAMPLSKSEVLFRMNDLFEQLAPASQVEALNLRIKKEVDDKPWTSVEARDAELRKIRIKFWRGKGQELERIFTPDNGTTLLQENFRKQINGDDYVTIPKEKLVDLSTMDKDQVEGAIEVIRVTKKQSGKKRMWTQKVLEERFDLAKADNFINFCIMGGILQNKEATKVWEKNFILLNALGKIMQDDLESVQEFVNAQTD